MEVIYLDGSLYEFNEPISCAIGFFDGIHLGHRQLIDKVIEVSSQKGYRKALMTFDHYPMYVLGKVKEEHCLTTIQDRQYLLEQLGFDYLFVIQFTKDVANISPEEFIRKYITSCHIKHLVCGFDFRFGKSNQGTVDFLRQQSEFDIDVIEEVLYRGEKISSTRIRHVLEEGNIDHVTALLGRCYSIQGCVIKGRHIGHTIGFPTANIDFQSYYLPHNGVYAVKVYRRNKVYIGMCNIGYNPTFEALDKRSLEVNIFDFDEDIYGEILRVEFCHMIRLERAFASKGDLVDQLKQDKQYVINYFEKMSF